MGLSDSEKRRDAYTVLQELYPDVFESIHALQSKIGYTFANFHLLYEAVTHRSVIEDFRTFVTSKLDDSADFEEKYYLPWNERLEFLGDAVLGLSVSTELMARDEGFAEGDLSKIRASLVNEDSLAEISREINLGSCLVLGKGEDRGGGRSKDSLLADCLEAVIGAVYLDAGFKEADSVVRRLFEEVFSGRLRLLTKNDYKTMLQELTQERFKVTPTYEVSNEQGPDHAKLFEVVVKVEDKEVARGEGVSKKKASQVAAELAYMEYKK